MSVPYRVHRYLRPGPMGVIDMVGGTFGHRGRFGHHGLFGHRGPFGRAAYRRYRRRSRWPQVLLGLLILAVVYALLSRDERQGGWW